MLRSNQEANKFWIIDRESVVTDLAARIDQDPSNIPLRFRHANLLAESGRTADAISAYWNLLTWDPSHRGSLNNLGVLLYATDRWQAARTRFC